MGFLDKIAFWKKGDAEFMPGTEQNLALPDFDKSLEPGWQSPLPPPPPAAFAPPSFSNFNSPQMNSPPMSDRRDMELIEAKLDTIKSLLDNLNQRMANLEKMARE